MSDLNLNFDNTEIAFSSKSDKELKKTAWLFRMMNNPKLVSIGTQAAMAAIKYNLPFTNSIIKNTIFAQFCGGEDLKGTLPVIDKLNKFNTMTVLDYGAESKTAEADLDNAMQETLRAIEMASTKSSVPVVSTKLTGLINKAILAKIHNKESLTAEEQTKFEHLKERVEKICQKAYEKNISIFVDAEESWIQDPIDDLVLELMEKYNKERAIVYNTYQMYNIYKYDHLVEHHKKCQAKGVILGAKLVRGAYMDMERNRAAEKGYLSPIHVNKQETDDDFDKGITYCMDHIETISTCCASHNAKSNMLQARLLQEKGLPKNHHHAYFCQLYGMSDNITFNLANAGYNAGKYVVYGHIKEVIPYLIRRTEENTSVTGEMSRELTMVREELKRRKG